MQDPIGLQFEHFTAHRATVKELECGRVQLEPFLGVMVSLCISEAINYARYLQCLVDVPQATVVAFCYNGDTIEVTSQSDSVAVWNDYQRTLNDRKKREGDAL